jgi:subfamily B ATP-binding cassette protein HlyB/CyaB
MQQEMGKSSVIDPGLGVFAILARFHGVAVEGDRLRHMLGTARIGIPEMLQAAKMIGLKARTRSTDWDRLANTPLPGIAALRDGGFLVIGRVADNRILVQAADEPRPKVLSRAEFEAVWDGQLVLLTRRAKLSDLTRRFDVTWFLGAINKYRNLFGLPAAVRPGDAAVLPGRDRQGAGPSGHEHARRAGVRTGHGFDL